MSDAPKDVIIVGAGIAGLYAANNLKNEGLDILVLEGRNRISGRQLNRRNEQFGYLEMAAAYVGKRQTKLLTVMNELGLKTYSKVTRLKSILHLKGTKVFYNPPVPIIRNPIVMLDLNNVIREVDKLSLQVPIEEPWTHPRAREWDNMTVQDYLDKIVWTRETMVLAQFCVSIPFIMEPRQMSLLHFLHTVRLCGGVLAITSIVNGLQEMKIEGGSDSVSTKLFERVKDNVLLEQFVTSVEQRDDGLVQVTTETGAIFKARRVLMATPLPALHNVTFLPDIPAHLRDFVSLEPQGHTLKAFVFYKTQFWKEKGLSGEMVCEEGAVPWAVDDTKPDGSHPVIMVFITADRAAAFAKMSFEERKDSLARQFYRATGLNEFLTPIHYEDKYWQDEEQQRYARGCCIWALPPGVLTKVKRMPVMQHGHLFFASSEFALTMRGYMDGALRASSRATNMVLQSLGKEWAAYNPVEYAESVPYEKQSAVERLLPGVAGTLTITASLILAAVVFIVAHVAL